MIISHKMAMDGKGIKRFATAVTCCSIVIISILLRVWCKYSLRNGIHAEDWFICAVIPVYIVAAAIDIWGLLKGGYGKDLSELVAAALLDPSPKNSKNLEISLKSLFIGFCISPVGLTAVRVSICLFYRRIFSTQRFRIQSMIMICISIAWFIVSIVVGIAFCIPIGIYWHPSEQGHCINFNLFYLLIGIFETMIDSAILALPVLATFQIQLPLKTKVFLSGIFLLGGFVVVTNAFRLSAVYKPSGTYVSVDEATFWTHIHSTTAVLCANIPIYKSLRTILRNLFSELRGKLSSPFNSLRVNPALRLRDSVDDPETRFHMEEDIPVPELNAYGRTEYRLGDLTDPVLVPREGGNVATARRSDTFLNRLDISHGKIVHTTKVQIN